MYVGQETGHSPFRGPYRSASHNLRRGGTLHSPLSYIHCVPGWAAHVGWRNFLRLKIFSRSRLHPVYDTPLVGVQQGELYDNSFRLV